jgi:hypothetical protein
LPSVDSPYETLRSYLNEKKNILFTLYEFDDVDQALKLFASKQAAENVILTGKDNRLHEARTRREASSESLRSKSNSSDWTQAEGTNCMISLKDIFIRDPAENKVMSDIRLQIVEPYGMELNCQNDSAMLELLFFFMILNWLKSFFYSNFHSRKSIG